MLFMIRLFYLIILFSCFCKITEAQVAAKKSNQDMGVIIGNLLDASNGKPVAFATVELIRISDTTLTITQISDKNGSFEFDKIKFSIYRLRSTATGFHRLLLDSINVRSERFDFNLGDLKMAIATTALIEIVVYAEKPLIEMKDDKLTYNVGESALSNSSTTSELLKSMPLISNDPNGKILLKGKEPKILIDDKPTELNSDQLKDLLESLPGSSIEKIELMTNPPPQYATESGGVINIVTKKGKIGFTGKATVTAGSRGEVSTSAYMNYRNNKFSFNTSLGVGASVIQGNSYSKRQNIYTDSSNRFNTEGQFKNKNLRPNLRFQADYEIDKKNSISITYQGNVNYFDNNNATIFTNINRFDLIYKLSNRSNLSEGSGYNHGVNFTYTKHGKTLAETFRFIISENWGKNDNDRDFYQQYLNSTFITINDSSQNQFFNNFSNSFSARLNYDKPLKMKGSSFSTGATFQRANYHNALNTSFLRKVDSIFIPNDILSSDFKFNQNISTARVAFTYTLLKTWRITAGIQAEFTQFDFQFLKGNSADVQNSYFNLLPTINIRKEFSKQFNTSFVYRSTVRRPGLGELNPNIDYGDPYNLRFGNPYLQPSTADNFDWNIGVVKGKYYFNTSLGYNKVKNIFNTIRTLIDGGKTQITWKNIADRSEYEASIFGGYTFSKKFRMNASAGYTYNVYGDAEKLLYYYRDGGSFYTSINYSYMPNNLLTFEGNARYSSYSDPQGRGRSNLNMTLGVQRKFFDKRLILGFNVVDPIVMQQYTTFVYGSNFNLETFNSTQTRNFRITISYQLNKIIQKSKISENQKQQSLQKIKSQPKPQNGIR